MGSSEGTRRAQLALGSPAGIVGLSLMSFQPDNIHDTVVWQNTVGVWRAITFLVPGGADGTITRAEYDEALKANASIAPAVALRHVRSGQGRRHHDRRDPQGGASST